MDELCLTISLEKSVPDVKAGRNLLELVKQKLIEHPDITISGHVTAHLSIEEP